MAFGRRAPAEEEENPYFDPNTIRRTSSATAPQQPNPTTPARERPPTLPRPSRLDQNASGSSAANNNNAVHRQQSSIGLRRLRTGPSSTLGAPLGLNSSANDWANPSNKRVRNQAQRQQQQQQRGGSIGDGDETDRRRRSRSEPERPTWLTENLPNDGISQKLPSVPEAAASPEKVTGRQRSGSAPGRRMAWLPRLPTRQAPQQQQQQQQQQPPLVPHPEYDSRIVDLLDVVDPEVSTLTSITNLQNSLFIPSLGRFVNRRPTYDVSSWGPPVPGRFPESLQSIHENQQMPAADGPVHRPSVDRTYSITSKVEDSHYAVLPHGASLEGWTQEEVDQLNDHVRHMLHSRRSKFKRSMKGFGSYVRRPLGFLVTLYATLITLFGLAWVLFLIGWINVGGKQLYIINVIDYTLVALFAIVGDGLAPFRAVDTYHMIFIAHYHRKSWKLREKLLLPDLRDHNDLPTEAVLPDVEAALETASIPSLEPGEEFSVLNPKQQARLTHHQTKYAKSHTFYRPHETETHFAFPLKLLVAITVLLDLHSCLQISLGSVTYGINYQDRPFALTTVILCCSITANATAGLLIWIGDRRTRKKDVIERMARQELTEEAMNKVKKQNQKAAEKEEAARREAEEEEQQRQLEAGGKKSHSLPRLSLDKFTSGTTADSSSKSNKRGERSSSEPYRNNNANGAATNHHSDNNRGGKRNVIREEE